MHRNLRPWLLAVLALAMPVRADLEVTALRQNNTSALRTRGERRGMVVRNRGLVSNANAVADLLLFCRQRGVDALFVASYDLLGSGQTRVERLYGWHSLLRRAHQQGIDVYALTGDSSWLNNTGEAYTQVDAVAAIGERGAPGEGFDGLVFDFPLLSQLQRLFPAPDQLHPLTPEQYRNGVRTGPALSDVERNQTRPGAELPGSIPAEERPLRQDQNYPTPPGYDPNQLATGDLENQELIRQYLDVLQRLRNYTRLRYGTQRLRLGAVIPAWLRVPVGWRDEVKYATDHFADLTDFLIVHNYPGETVAIGQAADGVIRYAGRTGKQVFCRVELSFPLRPQPELISLFRRDELFLETVVNDLLERHGATPGFAGIALDDYESYRALPDRRLLPQVAQDLAPGEAYRPMGR